MSSEKKRVEKFEATKPVEPKRLGVMETPGFVLPDSF
jgi:hypothetical protein